MIDSVPVESECLPVVRKLPSLVFIVDFKWEA